VREHAGHDLSAELHTTLVRDPFEVDADSAIVTAAREALGGDVPVIGVPFWADSAIFSAAGIPTVIFGPGGPPVYCPDEHLPVADIHEATKVYAMFAALALTGHPDANEAGYAAGGR